MKTVLITGSNRGLGLEFVRQYAVDGWQVIACCRHPQKATQLAQLTKQHKSIRLVPLDVVNHQQIDALANELRGSKLDVLISNAGIYGDNSRFGKLDYQAWRDTLETNVLSAMKLAEAFSEHLQKAQGLFVAISSLMGSMADNGSGGSYFYRSSKAALNAAMKSLAYEFDMRGIGVLIFHPGWVRTDMGGPHGLIEAEESISGMRKIIADFDMSQTGCFIKYDGTAVPW